MSFDWRARYSSFVRPEALRPPSSRSVRMRPGQSVLTRMFSLPSCSASVFIMPATPGRTALDSSRSSSGCLTDTDWIVRMRPHCFARMPGSTARISRTVDISETSTAPCQASSVNSSKNPRGGPPQLAMRMSGSPKACFTCPTSAVTSAALVTSARTASTSALVFARNSSAAAFSSPSFRAHMATRAPSAASPCAHARPIPLLAAVTSATFPFSPRSISRLLYHDALSRGATAPFRGPRSSRNIEGCHGSAGAPRAFGRMGAMSGPPILNSLEEFGPVAADDLQAADRVVAHHLERQLLAGLLLPEAHVELAAARQLLGVERDDHVALAQPALVGGGARHHARAYHAVLQRA